MKYTKEQIDAFLAKRGGSICERPRAMAERLNSELAKAYDIIQDLVQENTRLEADKKDALYLLACKEGQ